MKKTINKITTLILVSVLITSCINTPSPKVNGIYNDGYFVTNEGNFEFR